MTSQLSSPRVRTPLLGLVHFDLLQQGYVDIAAPGSVTFAMTRKTLHELVHRVAGAIELEEEIAALPELKAICADFFAWSASVCGRNGLTLLIFACAKPDERLIRRLLAPDAALQECPLVRVVFDGQKHAYWHWENMQGLLASHKAPA